MVWEYVHNYICYELKLSDMSFVVVVVLKTTQIKTKRNRSGFLSITRCIR